MRSPGQISEYLGTKSIAIATRLCRVVGRAITFDADRVDTRLLRMLYSHVYPIRPAADLGSNEITSLRKRPVNLTLQCAVEHGFYIELRSTRAVLQSKS